MNLNRLTFLFVLLFGTHLHGQLPTWEYQYNPNPWTQNYGSYSAVKPHPLGGTLFAGMVNLFGLGGIDSAFVTHLDRYGNLISHHAYSTNYAIEDVGVLPSGDYLLAGAEYYAGISITRIDPQSGLATTVPISTSNTIWRKGVYDDIGKTTFLGEFDDNGTNRPRLIQVDTNGTVLLDITYQFPQARETWNLIRTSDAGFVFGGEGDGGGYGYHITKVDSNGGMEWDKYYFAQDDLDKGSSIVERPGAGYSLALRKQSPSTDSLWLLQLDPLGDSTAQHGLDPSFYKAFNGLAKANGNVTFSGTMRMGPVSNTTYHGALFEVDPQGNVLWSSIPNSQENRSTELIDIHLRQDGGYHACGWGYLSYIALSLDTLGRNVTNLIEGTVFADDNLNCIPDPNELKLQYWIVRADPGPVFALTDSAGRYSLAVDSGNYTVQVISPVNVWGVTCPAPTGEYQISFNSWNDTLSNRDFGMTPITNCPALYVEMSSMIPVPCLTSLSYLTVRNLGTSPALGAYVLVDLDTLQTPGTNSSIPYTLVQPNLLRFDLDTLDPGESLDFNFDYQTACTAVLGESACSEAHIYPDSFCFAPPPTWDGSSVVVSGVCGPDDSLRFTIENAGLGNMTNQGWVWIAEDDILKQSFQVQLNSGQDTVVAIEANGSTWSCIAEQSQSHPGFSFPRIVLEGCGLNQGGTFSVGHVTTVSEDDVDLFKSIDCQIVAASFDPNDKQGFPVGTQAEHRILPNERLEYLIRFQNTGTAPAFRVVLRDSLQAGLDLGSLTFGASSHPYSAQILPGNVLEWVFDPIALPDSGADFLGSQGFVKFELAQTPDNPTGLRIENYADIYFDYNLPVRTNTTFHTIYEEFEDIQVILSVEEFETVRPALRYYPNPFQNQITFDLGEQPLGAVHFELYDLTGRLIIQQTHFNKQHFSLTGLGLQAGVYVFRIASDSGDLIGSGRILAR